jgi:hypothetical protein
MNLEQQGIRRWRRRFGFPNQLRPPAQDPCLGGLPLHDDVGELPSADTMSNDHHDFRRFRPERASRPKGFPHQALGSVPLHGIADATRRGNADPRPIGLVTRADQENEAG